MRKIIFILMIVFVCSISVYGEQINFRNILVYNESGIIYSIEIIGDDIKKEMISPPDELINYFSVNNNGKILLGTSKNRDSEIQNSNNEMNGILQVSYINSKEKISLSPDGNCAILMSRSNGKTIFKIKELEKERIIYTSEPYFFVQAPTWSPDGNKVAYYCGNRGLSLRVYDLSLNTDIEVAGESRTITFSGEFRDNATWSPDSKFIYFPALYEKNKHKNDLYKAWADGSIPPEFIASNVYCYSISPDGKILYVTNGDILTLNIDSDTKEKNLLISGASQPILSLDGKFLAYNHRTDGLWCRNLETGKEFRVGQKKFGILTKYQWTKVPVE